MIKCVRCLSFAALLCGAALAEAADWTNWRGPEYNGISRETGLIDDWSFREGTNVLWSSDIGGRSTPIVSQGKVYLNCRTHHDVTDPDELIDAQEQVVCWDAETGEVLWQDVFNVFQTDIPAPRVGWASMTADPETGNVYVHSVSGLFICYSADGERLWEYSLLEDFGKISGYGGRTQTPIIDEDRVIVSFMLMNWGERAGPPPRQTYFAFDKKDGRLIWMSAPGAGPKDTNYSVPTIAVIDGVRMLIGGNSDGGVYAIHARTGERLWGFQMSQRGLNSSPVVEGHRVYISHGEDNIDNNEFGRIQCIDGRGRGDITETHSLWRIDGVKAGYTGLLVKDGILYVVTDTGTMYGYDSETGQELWTHNLGTVGKGSPVWADGKVYVMEVNGNVHIVRPSKTECISLSHQRIPAADNNGDDEIYGSPAISGGRIYLTTRDRTLCLGDPDAETGADPVPPLPQENESTGEVALAYLVPAETVRWSGETVDYQLYTYDSNGRWLGAVEPTLELGDGWNAASVEGATFSTAVDAASQAGTVTASVDGVSASARLRTFGQLPWSWDFGGYAERQVPGTWVRAAGKLLPTDMDGDMVMLNTADRGRPSHMIWLGPSDMSGYTVQADVMLREQRFKISGIGVTNQRYNLIIKGNVQELSIQSWAPHLRMAQEIPFRSDPDVWYRMKLRVVVDDEGAHVQGKVWPRDQEEPVEWTIAAHDPHPNAHGAPGLYLYSLADSFFDNVQVTKDD